MSIPSCCRFLRPYPRKSHYVLSPPKQAAYLQFYAAVRSFSNSRSICSQSISSESQRVEVENPTCQSGEAQPMVVETDLYSQRDDVRRRIKELQAAQALMYPRIKCDKRSISTRVFRDQYGSLEPEESREGEIITLRGRLYSSRIAGSKLAFLDVVQNGCKVQGMCDLGRLAPNGVQAKDFNALCSLVRRGDIISITGSPTRTKRGELSIVATELPVILVPMLASLPTVLDDPQSRIRNRHADLLVNQRVADTLKLRSDIIQHLRLYFLNENFLEVQTPILADGAGGAVARPFITTATEFHDRTLALRIAPELWLKRLVIGGIDRVFEIGPVFRNEGLDATHNPEFTTCEFYKAFADLEELMKTTEALISGIAFRVNSLIQNKLLTALPILDSTDYSRPFKRIEFIPALEVAIRRKLPNLLSENASEQLTSLFLDLSLPLPSSPTLPRLLDKLSSHYLETQCINPTFIIHPPACLAPLSKSFIDPTTKQLVSARAELFINRHEIANMYEEENSPFEQRRKFIEQAQWQDDEKGANIDESYLEALEWGLPPTGGWGCGIDRLCMLFSNASRIKDVLSFGNLRNVVGLARRT